MIITQTYIWVAIYVCGTKAGIDALAISYSSDGVTTYWTDSYNGTGNGTDDYVALTSYGTGTSVAIYAVGDTYAGTASGTDMLLTKYTQAGTRTVQTWTSSGAWNDAATCVAVDAAGNIYIAGTTQQFQTGLDIQVWKMPLLLFTI